MRINNTATEKIMRGDWLTTTPLFPTFAVVTLEAAIGALVSLSKDVI